QPTLFQCFFYLSSLAREGYYCRPPRASQTCQSYDRTLVTNFLMMMMIQEILITSLLGEKGKQRIIKVPGKTKARKVRIPRCQLVETLNLTRKRRLEPWNSLTGVLENTRGTWKRPLWDSI